jgi:secreted PhoX family phosphatase
VSFLGNWTARIHDPNSIWLSSTNTVFSETNLSVAVGIDNQYGQITAIQRRPLTIHEFKPKIEVAGSFADGQTVTVRIRLEYVDNSLSSPATIAFTNTTSLWLTDDQFLTLYPSQNIIWAILIDAKTTSASTGVTVKVSGYGTAG